jgi:serine/threonine protein kinase
MNHTHTYEYRVGATLPPEAPSYVVRQADKDLYEGLKVKEFCYILNSRQMGKSSLEVRVRKRLEAEGFACALIDLTKVGIQQVTADEWYATLINSLADSLNLKFDLLPWWHDRRILTPLARFGEFIESVLLTQIDQNIVIFIDEIDSVLSLEFPTDDFFAFIRACYNQRNDKPAYQRLTFVLIGVATPSALIADKERTPFNLGRAIELHGFQISEVQPLAKGLENQVDDPSAVLTEILKWTGGQPFLTQKLCRWILKQELHIAAGTEAAEVEQFVRSRCITNWESQDEPEHLRTIRDRLFRKPESTGRLLGIYQHILQRSQIPADDGPEQVELQLSGLVVKRNGMLTVYNTIYRNVFNEQWVQEALAELRPYKEAMDAWFASECSDESRLLRGRALLDALAWAAGKHLTEQDQQFLQSSQDVADRITREFSEQLSKLAKTEAATILKRFMPELERISGDPSALIQEIQAWTGSQPTLTEHLCRLIAAGPFIPTTEETAQVEHLVQTDLIQDWEHQIAADHFRTLCEAILEDEKCVSILQLYRQILQRYNVIADDSAELRLLLNLGLVENQSGQLRVANRIYADVFDLAWVEQELGKAKERRIIGRRFEVIKPLNNGGAIQTYLAKDKHLPSQNQFVVKQLTPSSLDIDTLGKVRTLFNKRFKELETLNGHGQIPTLLASFEENQEFYTVQEFVEGHNLDDEIAPDSVWNEARVVALLIEILEILEFVHRQNLSHLNLQPANVKRRKQDGKLVLIDFGTLKEIHALAAPAVIASPSSVNRTGYRPPDEASDPLDEMIPTAQQPRSDASRDIYAVGMIGIQALTGLHPNDLPTDVRTGELIWRFAIPGKPMVPVSPELERILSKMVRHGSGDRYETVSEVLRELRLLKEKPQLVQPMAGGTNWRWLVLSLASLLLVSVAGYWGYRRVVQTQQLAAQIEQCNTPITAQTSNVGLVITANAVQESCSDVLQHQPNQVDALKNRAQALLLLWQNESAARETLLARALADFQKASEIDPSDPQTFFYLGLTQSLQGNAASRATYQSAIDLYLEKKSEELDPADLPILAQLGHFLIRDQNPSQENFERAEAIFHKAQTMRPISMSLIYNQASINARNGNYREAIRLFERVIEKNPKNASAWRSRGFAFLLLGQAYFPDALESFQQAQTVSASSPSYLSNYMTHLKDCLSAGQTTNSNSASSGNASCTINNLTRDRLSSMFTAVFPYLPVYPCQNYPLLAMTKTDVEKSLCQ